MGRPRKTIDSTSASNKRDPTPISSSRKQKKARNFKAERVYQEEEQEQEQQDELVVLNELKRKPQKNKPDADLSFLGSPVPAAEAAKKWPARYRKV